MSDDELLAAMWRASQAAEHVGHPDGPMAAILAVVRAHDRDGARLAHLASKLSESALYRMLYPSYVVGSDIDGLRAAIDAAIAAEGEG